MVSEQYEAWPERIRDGMRMTTVWVLTRNGALFTGDFADSADLDEAVRKDAADCLTLSQWTDAAGHRHWSALYTMEDATND